MNPDRSDKADVQDATTGSAAPLWIRMLLYPGHTLPTAIAPVLIGAGLALHFGVFSPVPLLLAFLGSWLIHIAGVFTDNLNLLGRHADVPEHPELLAAVDDGRLRLSVLRLAAITVFGAGALFGLPLLVEGGWPALVVGVAGLVSAWGYAGQPLAYAARGLADVVFFAMFAIVAPLGTYYIQAVWHAAPPAVWTGMSVSLPPITWIAGASVGALVVCVLIIDDIRDRRFDARKGWRTPAVRFGLAFSRAEFVSLMILAHLWPLALWTVFGFTPWVLLAWLAVPEAVAIVRAVLRYDTTEKLFPYTPRTSRLAALHALLLAMGMAAR